MRARVIMYSNFVIMQSRERALAAS
eukprot:COSAG06_NODE_66753_length_253_cov_1.259740_2_plen_24_part_01